jgi:uncharacterized protein YgbK (DUF1537 family)
MRMNSASLQPVSNSTASPGVSSQTGSQPRVLLLADDLTGACDSSLAFVKAGLSVSVSLSAAQWAQSKTTPDVLALTTETRNLSACEAEQRLLQLGILAEFHSSLLFKKVDSAGRGNPGLEILAVARLAACDAIVYAPAFPAAGRTIHNGTLRVCDVSGLDEQLHLLSLIPASAHQRVAHIPAQDAAALSRTFQQSLASGKDIWLCDALEQDDLRQIARAASSLPLRLLWAGSAGLAEAVAESIASERTPSAPLPTARSTPGCTLLISGTAHPVTSLQMQRLARAFPPSSCVTMLLDWHTVTADAIRSLWHSLRPPVDSLVLTGGDTAAFVLHALHATSLRLSGEVEPGIPWGIIDDGLAQGCATVTKSGGFGNEFSLNHAVDFCSRLRA